MEHREYHLEGRRLRWGVIAFWAFLFHSCQAIKIDVGTKEAIKLDPIKVDVTMNVNVNHHASGGEKKETKEAKNLAEATKRQRDRMAEIQELKNNRLVGENRLGLLSIRQNPSGDYGEYVKKTVEAENLDRSLLMTHRANEKEAELSSVQEEIWRTNRQNSFQGEWVEVEGESSGSWTWVQIP